MTDGEAGFLAALIERHGRITGRTVKLGKNAYWYLNVYLSRVPKKLALWLIERCAGTQIEGEILPFCKIKFVRDADACNALVNAYPHLLSLKEPAQIFFRYVKTVGRQGSRLSKRQIAERNALAERLAACRMEE